MPREKADTTLQRSASLRLRHGQRRALVCLKEEISGTSADNFQSMRYAVLLKRSAEKNDTTILYQQLLSFRGELKAVPR